jgi:hypothetical protein
VGTLDRVRLIAPRSAIPDTTRSAVAASSVAFRFPLIDPHCFTLIDRVGPTCLALACAR